jgi:hypothetical protein
MDEETATRIAEALERIAEVLEFAKEQSQPDLFDNEAD